ncbi:MFS transporter [Xenorhabdus innexi]|uniref:Inner membrane transport protein ynfM n=1 Tax=Xenorhabdus innexi TaxID=290109 RepID=A0A1N6MY41_9GAMM|nr:MFS transporter [Xenorhabdus innexi]PHM38825.1 permease [Xenorhabdus innexi]SIP73731.1 Inner membrane transport protein ynfM [Xenorhabdus innexi]
MGTISEISGTSVGAGVPRDTEKKVRNREYTGYIQRNDPAYLRVTLSFFTVGLATFALLYFIQPILPILSKEFSVSPANSSLALSLSTGMLSLGLLITGPLSDAIGRKNVIVISLIFASLLTLLSSITTSWHGFLIIRALVGLSLSGVAAVAMTYLSEEIHPGCVALSIGLYISGNSFGGMSGRLITGVIADDYSWHLAVILLGSFSLIAALVFWMMLPPSKHFKSCSLKPKALFINLKLHFRDQGLPLLFAEAFLLMGGFVTMFNYIGYRLLDAPYHLSQTVVGLLSVVYLTGVYSAAKAGASISHYGRGKVLLIAISMMLIGNLIMIFSYLWALFFGLTILTMGFFAAHTVASGWIGARTKRAKAQASSLYLFCYYAGSSISGTLGGIFWSYYQWNGVAAFISLLMIAAFYIGIKLNKLT